MIGTAMVRLEIDESMMVEPAGVGLWATEFRVGGHRMVATETVWKGIASAEMIFIKIV